MKTLKFIFLYFCIFGIFIKLHGTQETSKDRDYYDEPFPNSEEDFDEDEDEDKIVHFMDEESLAGERCDPGDG